jgi:3-hydroxyacyl-[acyl-carrier-protein] dehydratase
MLDISQIEELIPHRYPFLLIDRIDNITKKESAVGYKNISISDAVFQGHFPKHPVYPGVLIIEGLAQTGGVLAFWSAKDDGVDIANKVVYFMAIDNAKFRLPVKPGDKLVYKVGVIKQKGSVWVLRGEAFVDDKLVCEADLKAMVVDK